MQNIIVALIGVFVFGYLASKIYNLMTRKPDLNSKCGGCTGCSLKNEVQCESK